MRMLVIIEVGTIALATCTAFAQTSVAPTEAGVCEIGFYACPSHVGIQATWPARCPLCRTTLRQMPSPTLVHDNLGPAIDMDSRRQDEEIARERKRREELKERYHNYGYAYPPGRYGYTYPPGGYRYPYPPERYTHPRPQDGYRYQSRSGLYLYNPQAGYYRDPTTGRYRYVNPRFSYPGNERNDRSNE
jgi:hypothetical protein